jgi:hypothetical protein
MTTRTASLLFLFLAAVGATFVLAGLGLAALARLDTGGPWVIPAAAWICGSGMFFLGRRYILPHGLARSTSLAAVTSLLLTAATLATVAGAAWAFRRAGAQLAVPWMLALWFVTLWVGIAVIDSYHRGRYVR